MDLFWTIFWIVIFVNSVLAMITIFSDRNRDITSIWAWLLVIIMLPGVGFVIYLFLGRKISKENIFDLKKQKHIGQSEKINKQKLYLRKKLRTQAQNNNISPQTEMANMLSHMSNSMLTYGNRVKIFNDGHEKFSSLLEDIEKAEDHIHLVYYIFRGDKIGKKIKDALERKANQGVDVKVLYDPVGARLLNKSFFGKLENFGGLAYPSFGSKFHLLNIRLNFRNHRKIVVIDGKIAYTGGFNVGDEYVGGNEEMGYWRDTHLKIEGPGVGPLQTRFFMDWNASADAKDHLQYEAHYFPRSKVEGDINLQVVSSGPDSEMQEIKKGYIKMISMAKETISIQTPYFIPDDSIFESLQIAILSGVEVRLMIPNKPDHPFIYQATLSYAQQLHEAGGKVYIYDKGFIHSKTMVVDNEILTIGTANMDIRSFKLNFEVNVFLYNQPLAKEYFEVFESDIKDSYQLTDEIIDNYSLWQIFKQQFSRLLSPIL